MDEEGGFHKSKDRKVYFGQSKIKSTFTSTAKESVEQVQNVLYDKHKTDRQTDKRGFT